MKRPVCQGCSRPMVLQKESRYNVQPDGRVAGVFFCPDPSCLCFDFGGYIDPKSNGAGLEWVEAERL